MGKQPSNDLLCLTYGDGTNRTFEKLMRTLRRAGHRPRVWAWDRGKRFEATVTKDDIEYAFIMRGWGYAHWRLTLGRFVWMIRLFIRLLRERPQRIWAANFETALPTALALAFYPGRFIYYIHDNVSISHKFPPVMKWALEAMDSWIIRRSELVIVPDDNRILEHAGNLRSKFLVVPNTPVARDELPAGPSVAGPLTIYCNGSLQERRGMYQLLEACRDLDGCRILAAGRVSDAAIATALRKHAGVDFRGSVSHAEAIALYNEAEIVFAYYSPDVEINRLASPTKAYESFMAGRAVILNREVTASRNFESAGVAFTAAYSDVAELRKLIQGLANDRARVARAGMTAAELFRREYDWRIMSARLVDVVNRVFPVTDASSGQYYADAITDVAI